MSDPRIVFDFEVLNPGMCAALDAFRRLRYPAVGHHPETNTCAVYFYEGPEGNRGKEVREPARGFLTIEAAARAVDLIIVEDIVSALLQVTVPSEAERTNPNLVSP